MPNPNANGHEHTQRTTILLHPRNAYRYYRHRSRCYVRIGIQFCLTTRHCSVPIRPLLYRHSIPLSLGSLRRSTSTSTCLLKIDTSDFPSFSTVIEMEDGKRLSLLSCYNIYSWQGFRAHKVKFANEKTLVVGVISLKLEDYRHSHNAESLSVETLHKCILDDKWTCKLGESFYYPNANPAGFIHNLCCIWRSYERHFVINAKDHDPFPLTWLNTCPFKVISPMAPITYPVKDKQPKKSGVELDGYEFSIFIQQQDRWAQDAPRWKKHGMYHLFLRLFHHFLLISVRFRTK